MSNKTTPPTNGKAIEPTAPTETPKVLPISTEVKKPVVEFLDLPPVEDRILKVHQLFAQVEKHETLLETKKKLKAFKLSTDGNRDVLKILDSKGNEFTTSNSAVIADVLNVLNTSLDNKISEVEAQIKF